MADPTDFTLTDHGSVVVLTPLTGIAKEWLDRRMPDDAMRWGGGYVLEPRFVDFVVEDLIQSDFVVGAA